MKSKSKSTLDGKPSLPGLVIIMISFFAVLIGMGDELWPLDILYETFPFFSTMLGKALLGGVMAIVIYVVWSITSSTFKRLSSNRNGSVQKHGKQYQDHQ